MARCFETRHRTGSGGADHHADLLSSGGRLPDNGQSPCRQAVQKAVVALPHRPQILQTGVGNASPNPVTHELNPARLRAAPLWTAALPSETIPAVFVHEKAPLGP